MARDSTLKNTGDSSPQALTWNLLENLSQTSPMIQELRIHLPTQGVWVQSQVWEDSTYHGATKPICHDYHAHTLLRSPWSVIREATAMISPWAATRENPHTAMKSQSSRKSINQSISKL